MRRSCLLSLVFLTAFVAFVTRSAAQVPPGTTALEGIPDSRVDTSADRTTRQALRPPEAERGRLRIRVQNGRYFWTSQRDQPLTLATAGEFTYLLSNDPGHYVRIRQINDRWSYVEHLETPLGTVTYWGELRVVLGK